MLYHNSHDTTFRQPVGPIKAGGALTIRFLADDAQSVTLRTWNGEERRVPMRAQEQAGMFAATISVPDEPMLFWYDFIIQTPQGEKRYGTSYDQLGGEGALYDGTPQSYQVTVYDPAYQTPRYLHHGIIYQIFPDRFYRGSGKAPTILDDETTDHRRKAISSTHPEAMFHQTWDEEPVLDPDPANGDNRALDFFGGTLRGVEEKLDYLQALGVTILYLNPIFRARTNHRYDTGDYEQVDPILGDASDFIHLARSAKRRGMELILDGVFSHTGIDSKYFNRFERYDDVGAYQSVASPYFDWYDFTDYPDQYAAWWGIYTLPAVRKENPAYQRYLLDAGTGVLPQWVRRGACGWRLDVVDELPMAFVSGMRKAVKHERADAALIGEVWEDASNKISYGALRSYCLGDSLDSVMNYPLRRAVIDFLTGLCSAGALARVILHQREVYPTPFYYSLMNLLGSHDRVRILNALSGYDCVGAIQLPREQAGKIRLTEEQLEAAKALYLLALKLLCALPGAPTVYYGDEMGMQGMADPWNRAPMVWDRGDAVLWHEVCTLLNHRRTTSVLQTGYLDVQARDDDTLVIRRYFQNGLDVFGESQRGAEETTIICRRG